jgi:uncharacterized protein YndB with AHSA1/START domain
MKTDTKTIEFKFERTILAPLEEVFDAWLDPKVPGTPWYESDKIILNPEVDGFFYWLIRGNPHYGRFTEIARPNRIQHTWMSPSTLGQESTVTLTFKKKGEDTLMTLHHTGLPDADVARGHDKGWNYFLDKLVDQLGAAFRKSK